MEPKERNRIVDDYFARNVKMSCIDHNTAIRECDKKARAWDKLYNRMLCETGDCAKWHKDQMDSLTPPTPKDPLEELEQAIPSITYSKLSNYPGSGFVQVEDLLAEIRRLREKT